MMMKKVLSLFLCAAILLTGCTADEHSEAGKTSSAPQTDIVMSSDSDTSYEIADDVQYTALDDENYLTHIEDVVYDETVKSLNSEQYFVENVKAIYVSKEYLQETDYNSQSNIYFGYSLTDLNEVFQDSKYLFTLGEDGTTTVQQIEEIEDTTSEEILTNIAIGTGVILLCVTVSVVSGGLGAPAISVIFAASAKTGTIMALSSAALGGISAGIVKGIETGDINETLKSAAISASEEFKWGAIAGAISGGLSQTIALKGATLKGLTMNEAAKIQKESKWPLDFIKTIHSFDEYNVYKNSGLQLSRVNGKYALTQSIDWDFIGDISDGRTNFQRVLEGFSPLDPTGKPYELHHIGQQADSPLAILTSSQHHDNYAILHTNTGSSASNIDRNIFLKEKEQFWKALYSMSQ